MWFFNRAGQKQKMDVKSGDRRFVTVKTERFKVTYDDQFGCSITKGSGYDYDFITLRDLNDLRELKAAIDTALEQV